MFAAVILAGMTCGAEPQGQYRVTNEMPRYRVKNEMHSAAPTQYTQVCENGVCRLVPMSQGAAPPSGSACATGTCSTPTATVSGGWYPGKFLGRRR